MLSDVGGVSSIAATSAGSSDAIGVAYDQANANRLQRQKAGSRKTFKFRKTRKDVSMKLCLTHFYFILPFDTPITPRIVWIATIHSKCILRPTNDISHPLPEIGICHCLIHQSHFESTAKNEHMNPFLIHMLCFTNYMSFPILNLCWKTIYCFV